MAYATTTYPGTGAQVNFALDFPYLDQEHVFVFVDGAGTAFTWLNASTVTVSPAPALDAVVTIKRNTSRGIPLVDYTNGQLLTEFELDHSYLHALYVAQEAFDANELSESITDIQLLVDAAANSAAEAAISEAEASNSADDAANSATLAASYVGDALAYSEAASDSADAAAISAAAAAASEAAVATVALLKANNLSDLTNAATARSNLSLGTMAVATATDYLAKAGNLSGLADAATSRTNLGLGSAATHAHSDYATSAQGTKADSALQPNALTTTDKATIVAAGGTSAALTAKMLEIQSTTANTDASRWVWIHQKVSADDYLKLYAIKDDGSSMGALLMSIKRTGTVGGVVDFPGTVSVGSLTLLNLLGVYTAQSRKFVGDAATPHDYGNMTGSPLVDMDSYQVFKSTLTGSITPTFADPTYTTTIKWYITQGSGGSKTLTYPSNVKWDERASAADKLLSTVAGRIDLLVLAWDGTNYVANLCRNIG